MENQIIQQLGKAFEQILPTVQKQVKTLKDFAIFSGATLKMKAPPQLKDLVDAKSWYITMKFDSNGTREDAKKAFEISMVDCLGLPRTNQNIDDELIPKKQNDYSTPAPSSVPQLGMTPGSDGPVIDIDDKGDVVNGIAPHSQLASSPVSKYYAVEFKIFGMPMPAGKLGGPGTKTLGKHSWKPHLPH